ncbi:MAG TPA: hypothetical protein VNW47_15685 [Terriglobales bacterium]|nr:hypothetical protein [Terriglobales bacterium]
MDASHFQQTWAAISQERSNLVNRRTELETELVEVRNKIKHLTEVLNHLGPLAELPYYSDDEISNLGITDAVRLVFRYNDEKFSPQDVRKQLGEKGYDMSSLTAPMASIYKILSRLEEAGEIEREKEEGRVYYKWKSPPITEDDIPF